MAGQIKTKSVSVSSVVGSAAFQAGVSDYQRGLPPRFDDLALTTSRGRGTWDYERGRLFAAAMVGEGKAIPPSRAGRSVSHVAIRELALQFKARSVL